MTDNIPTRNETNGQKPEGQPIVDSELEARSNRGRSRRRRVSREDIPPRFVNDDDGYKSAYGDLAVHNEGYAYRREKKIDGEIRTEYNRVTNFVIEVLRIVKPPTDVDDSGEMMEIRVHPANGESKDLLIPAAAMNETRDFRAEIAESIDLRYTPGASQKPNDVILGEIKETLRMQDAPRIEGTEQIGYHGDEIVLPEGSIGPDGWLDNPKLGVWGDPQRDNGLWRAIDITSEETTDYDPDHVARICELLPNLRSSDQILLPIGWAFAATVRPLILDRAGEYPLLAVTGQSGAGKTVTISPIMRALGLNGNPVDITSESKFTIQNKLSASLSIPVWLDEFKPSIMAERRLEWLQPILKHSTGTASADKGRSSLDSVGLDYSAPVAISGEQEPQEVAVRRRSVLTKFSSSGKIDEDVEELISSYNFGQHAVAYYQWLAGLSENTIVSIWEDPEIDKLIDDLDADLQTSERKTIRTVVSGMILYKMFAKEIGADPDELPDLGDLKRAVEHMVDRIGPDGHRRQHIDEYVELVSAAAQDGYLSEGEQYAVIESPKHGTCIGIHMDSTYTAISRYLRDYGLDNVNLLSKKDYNDSFRDKSRSERGYVQAHRHNISHKITNGSKGKMINIEDASEVLDGFQKAAFIDVDDEDERDDRRESETPITDVLETTQTQTIPKPVEGAVSKSGVEEFGSGKKIKLVEGMDIVDVVDWNAAHDLEGLVGKRIRIIRAQSGEYNGSKQIKLVPESKIKILGGLSDGQQQGLNDAVAEEPPQNERIADVKEAIEKMAPVRIKELEAALSDSYRSNSIESTVKNLKNKGLIHRPDEEGWRPTN